MSRKIKIMKDNLGSDEFWRIVYSDQSEDDQEVFIAADTLHTAIALFSEYKEKDQYYSIKSITNMGFVVYENFDAR